MESSCAFNVAALTALSAAAVLKTILGPPSGSRPAAETPTASAEARLRNEVAALRRQLGDLRRRSDVRPGFENAVHYPPLGLLQSCFKERNGTPRQGLHAPHARAKLRLAPGCGVNGTAALEGLGEYTHVWLIFDFHDNVQKKSKQKAKLRRDGTPFPEPRKMVKPRVHPPMLDGAPCGLFSTRTPHRPNAIGLSLVLLERVEGDTLLLRGTDLIDGTPILDIKPYHPLDCMPDATCPAWVTAPLVAPLRSVELSAAAEAELRRCVGGGLLELYSDFEDLRLALVECIRLDMRRTQHRKKFGAGAGTFGFSFDTLNVVFEMRGPDAAEVTSVEHWPRGKVHRIEAC